MTPREIADAHGLRLASELPPRPGPGGEPPEPGRRRLPPDIKAELGAMGPHALCVVGTDGPVSITVMGPTGEVTRRIGHNRGCWPLKLAASGSIRDTVTPRYDVSPFVWTGVQIRVWCVSDAHEKRLALGVAELLGRMAESCMGAELLNGFVDAGPDLQMPFLEMEIHALAGRLGLQVWDDDGLLLELERRVKAKRMRAA